MSIQNKIRKQNKPNLKWWVVYAAGVSCLFVTIISNASFTAEASEIAKIQARKPIIEIIDITKDEINNAQMEIEFSVRNFNPEREVITETTLLYNLEIAKNENIDLTYILYKDEIKEENEITMTKNKTPEYVMTHTEKQTDQYILVVEFGKAPSPKDAKDAIIIYVYAEQQTNNKKEEET